MYKFYFISRFVRPFFQNMFLYLLLEDTEIDATFAPKTILLEIFFFIDIFDGQQVRMSIRTKTICLITSYRIFLYIKLLVNFVFYYLYNTYLKFHTWEYLTWKKSKVSTNSIWPVANKQLLIFPVKRSLSGIKNVQLYWNYVSLRSYEAQTFFGSN